MAVQDTTISNGAGIRTSLRVWTLALIAAATLAGCGGGGESADRAAASKTAPEAAPSVDDSSVTIESPAPEGASSTVDGAPQPVVVDPSPEPVPSSALDPAGTGAARTTPGVADKATALPPSATVPNDGRCRISSLRLAPIDLQGSPGGTYANFRLTNASRSACAVRGFVDARLIGDGGNEMATSVRREAGPDVWVKVAPGGSAQFHLRFPNPMSGENPCNPPNAAKVRISLAGVAGSLTSATPEGGIQACNGALSTAPIGST